MSKLRITTCLILAALVAIIAGCGGGKGLLIISEITGDGGIDENSVGDYSISVSNDKFITYQWALDPPSLGSLNNATASTASYHAPEVTANTGVTLLVEINSKKHGPIIVRRDITIMDTNRLPSAAAHCDKPKIGHGQSVQFYDDSSDPEGDNDIILREWDFSFNQLDGFQTDSIEAEPSHRFDVPGLYDVQLRVTDRSGATDLLNTPIAIEVVENYAPVIASVNHSRTTSQAGNTNEAVQLSVDFTDAAPLDDTHTYLWACDYGSFDDPISPNPVWYPPDGVLECDITVQVTDWFGLSDEGTCRQWVTSLPVFGNASAPGNVIISQNLDTAFSGVINPADFAFPNDDPIGTVIFISYWATYSSSSTEGVPLILDVYEMYKNDDYVQLMINEGETAAEVITFVNLNLYEATFWPLDMDASYFTQTSGWAAGSGQIPQHLLFDRDGRCRWVYVGQLASTTELVQAIQELL